MLNKEKYAKEIIEIACNGGNIAVVNGKLENCRKTQCNECNFNGGTIRDCEIKTRKWANSEYVEPIEPQVDWSRVPVDTPILVRHSESCGWDRRYFAKYNKAKRTLAALEIQEKQNNEELAYLESVLNALENAKEDADLSEIRTELAESGFIRRQAQKKGQPKPKRAKPLRYISSDGYEILVGKSNLQNDELTLRTAEPTDLWMHTKDIPGSHVIIRTNGQSELPEATMEEAANLAAFYSKAKNSSMVPVDYTQRKNIKKPNGAKPGMVIYLTNKTIYITPDEARIQQMKNE